MNVYVPQKNMAGIKHTVAQAIDNGVDSYEMESLLAGAAQSMGDLPSAIDAIKKIADERPDSFDVTMRLGELYGENHDFNQAVIMLTRAIQLRPDSALAYYSLAGADEQPTTTPTPTRRSARRPTGAGQRDLPGDRRPFPQKVRQCRSPAGRNSNPLARPHRRA